MQAVDGKIMSGVVVATTIRSTSAGAMPAAASACRAAASARSDVCSSSAAMCRARMPVRCDDPFVAGVDPPREIGVGDDVAPADSRRCRRCGYASAAPRFDRGGRWRDGLRRHRHRRHPLRDLVEHAVGALRRAPWCSADSNASASAEPWLLTTMPLSPSSLAPLWRRGSMRALECLQHRIRHQRRELGQRVARELALRKS